MLGSPPDQPADTSEYIQGLRKRAKQYHNTRDTAQAVSVGNRVWLFNFTMKKKKEKLRRRIEEVTKWLICRFIYYLIFYSFICFA